MDSPEHERLNRAKRAHPAPLKGSRPVTRGRTLPSAEGGLRPAQPVLTSKRRLRLPVGTFYLSGLHACAVQPSVRFPLIVFHNHWRNRFDRLTNGVIDVGTGIIHGVRRGFRVYCWGKLMNKFSMAVVVVFGLAALITSVRAEPTVSKPTVHLHKPVVHTPTVHHHKPVVNKPHVHHPRPVVRTAHVHHPRPSVHHTRRVHIGCGNYSRDHQACAGAD